MAQESRGGRRRLTKRAVDAARYRGDGRRQHILWDGELRGFGVRVQPTGRKSWVLFYRTTGGRKRLYAIGRYPELTLDQARREAQRLAAEVQAGGDPVEERRQTREAPTFADLAEAYLERHARVHKRTARDDEQRIRDHLKPAWGARKADSITRADVAALHRKVGRKAPYAANRLVALVSHLYAWGEREGYLSEGHPNPARGVRRYRETARDRWLTPEEVKGLLAALADEPNVYVRAFFWLALFTGCRKGELLAARWADVDLDRGLLRLPRTKAGRVHYVPLAAPARALLERLPREAGNPHLFPGLRQGDHLVNVDKAWRRIRTEAGCEDARLHDLRRTVGSWLAQNGASLPLIGAVLNHSNPTTTAIYARLSEQASRAALEAHGERLVHLGGGPEAAGHA